MFATARMLLAIGLIGVAAWAVTTQPAGENLVKNGSFETPGPFGSVGAPDQWEGMTMGTFPAVVQDCTVARDGRCSVKIMTDKFVMASLLQTVKLKPNQYYRLTAWVKTEHLETQGPADMYGTVVVLPNEVMEGTEPIKGTNHGGTLDWTQVSVEFQADATGVMNMLCNFCGQGGGKGFVWFDDVRLVPIDKRTTATNSAPAGESASPGGPTTRPAASRPG